MECTEISTRLGPLLDGELPATEAQQVQTHVSQCLECQGELRSLEALSELSAALIAPEVAPVEWNNRWQSIQMQLGATQSGVLPDGGYSSRYALSGGAVIASLLATFLFLAPEGQPTLKQALPTPGMATPGHQVLAPAIVGSTIPLASEPAIPLVNSTPAPLTSPAPAYIPVGNHLPRPERPQRWNDWTPWPSQ